MTEKAKAFVKNVLVFAASRQPSAVLNCSRQFSRGELMSSNMQQLEAEISQANVEANINSL